MADDLATEVPFRILPQLDDRNRAFWTSGGRGALEILRCQTCGYYIHPPTPICPECLGSDLAPEPVSGRATVATFSINHQPWMPGPEFPFVAALVELVEAPAVRLWTNIVGLRAGGRPHRHGGGGRVRTPSRCRWRHLPPDVHPLSPMEPTDEGRGERHHRAAHRHLRHRPERDRPTTLPRSTEAHPRRLRGRHRRCRSHGGRHRRRVDLSGIHGHPGRLHRRRRHRRHRRPAHQGQLPQRGARDLRPARLHRQRLPGRRGRTGQPRPVLPFGVGRLGPGCGGTRRGHARRG